MLEKRYVLQDFDVGLYVLQGRHAVHLLFEDGPACVHLHRRAGTKVIVESHKPQDSFVEILTTLPKFRRQVLMKNKFCMHSCRGVMRKVHDGGRALFPG